MPEFHVLLTVEAFITIEADDIYSARDKVKAKGTVTVLNEAELVDYEIHDVERA